MMRSIVVIGASGQAREVEWMIRDRNAVRPEFRFLGYVVTDTAKLTANDTRDRVLGDYTWLDKNRSQIDCIAIGIGSPAARLKVASEVSALLGSVEWPVLTHPSAVYDQSSCTFGRGVLLAAGFVGTVNLRFDDFVMANFGCTVGHESRIGRGSVINPGANISGGVVLDEAVLVGTGAQILQYVHIGANSSVGAGAVVTKDVAAGQTVVGVPAKPLERKSSHVESGHSK